MLTQFKNNKIVLLAPAKINLHLEILGSRSDGFHELSMVMQTIDLADIISISKRADNKINLNIDNSNLSNGEDNLVIKAANLLKKYSRKPHLGVDISLKKNIPIGAGLAGGSSDAAATLFGLNKLWDLGLSIKDLESISSSIGSDIPFCISGGTQLCFGRGEILEPASLSTSSLAIILIKDPSVSVSTPWAYSLNKDKNHLNYLTTQDEFEEQRNKLRLARWLNSNDSKFIPPLYNDLEKVVAPLTPSIEKALSLLKAIPSSLSVAMSGSGPSCFAIFPALNSAQKSLEDNLKILESEGFSTWCCSFLDVGVHLQNE